MMSDIFIDLTSTIQSKVADIDALLNGFFDFYTLSITLVIVAVVAMYKSVVDPSVLRLNKIQIYRTASVLISVLLLVSGMHTLLYVTAIISIVLNMFLDIKETANKSIKKCPKC